MLEWKNIKAGDVHQDVAKIFELSKTLNWNPSEFYIACKMIIHFIELQYGCVWIDEEKFIETLSDFKAK